MDADVVQTVSATQYDSSAFYIMFDCSFNLMWSLSNSSATAAPFLWLMRLVFQVFPGIIRQDNPTPILKILDSMSLLWFYPNNCCWEYLASSSNLSDICNYGYWIKPNSTNINLFITKRKLNEFTEYSQTTDTGLTIILLWPYIYRQGNGHPTNLLDIVIVVFSLPSWLKPVPSTLARSQWFLSPVVLE